MRAAGRPSRCASERSWQLTHTKTRPRPLKCQLCQLPIRALRTEIQNRVMMNRQVIKDQAHPLTTLHRQLHLDRDTPTEPSWVPRRLVL